MHVSLPRTKTAEVSIVNIFEPDEGSDILTFDSDSFSAREVFVNGTRRRLLSYIEEKGVDTRLPLVADCGGAMVNTSFLSIDQASGEVRFGGPLFRGVRYRRARPIGDYVKVFSSQLEAIVGTEISYSANCVLNYIYAGMEGRGGLGVTGPATFGEIAYQLLNQTLVYLKIVDTNLAERLRREMNQRRRFQALETLTQELSAYDFTVSHDLRAPLRRISWFSQKLRLSSSIAADEQARACAAKIEEAAGKMARLLDDLLDLSRAGRCELGREPVDLNVLVESVRQELAPPAEERKLTWRIHRLPVVSGDQRLLRQALTNLLSNAIKYTQRNPDAVIEIGARREGRDDVVFVSDNGIGFDPRHAEALFKPFQRLESSGDFPGTGVGLAIVGRIIERHGGRVWAEASPGCGARFSFALPRRTD